MASRASNGRIPRGRGRNRPCDFCRERKIACIMATGPPCRKCSESNRQCTFARGAPSRGSQTIELNEQSALSTALPITQPNEHVSFTSFDPLSDPSTWYHSPGLGFELSPYDLEWQNLLIPPVISGGDPIVPVTSPLNDSVNFAPATEPIFAERLPNSQRSTDDQPTLATFPTFLGLTSEMDPSLRMRYMFDKSSRFKSQFREFQRLNQSWDTPTIMLLTPREPCMKMGSHTVIDSETCAIEDMKPYHSQLLSLFLRFVQPVYPVADDVEAALQTSSNTAYLIGVYLHALEWRSFDPTLPWVLFESQSATRTELPDPRSLHRLVWELLLRELHAPTYETLKSVLLHMERKRFTKAIASTPFDICLASTAVTLALSLGLNQNCETWNTAVAEESKRNTLWWSVYIQDAWISITNGQAPKIRHGDYDTALPWRMELDEESSFIADAFASHPYPCFCLLLLLTDKLRLIYESFYSFTSLRARKPGLTGRQHQIQHSQEQLRHWKAVYDLTLVAVQNGSSQALLCGTGSLEVGYLYCQILVLRYAFRLSAGRPEEPAYHDMGMQFATELTNQMSRFDIATFESFWFSWSVGHFNAIGDFMFYLYITAYTAEIQAAAWKALQTYRAWLWSRSKAFEVTRMSLIRLDSLIRSDAAGNIQKRV